MGAWLGACLCLASLYLAGAGSSYALAWLCVAALMGLASAINFGVFDSRVAGLKRAIRMIGYLSVVGCVVAIVLDQGYSEFMSLVLAGIASGLMYVCAFAEPAFSEPGNK